MTALVDLRKSLLALSSKPEHCYANWHGTGFFQLNGLWSFLSNLPAVIWGFSNKDTPTYQTWQKQAAANVQTELERQMGGLKDFTKNPTTRIKNHSELCRKVLYMSDALQEINLTTVKKQMQVHLGTNYSSNGFDQLASLAQVVRDHQEFLQWCAFTNAAFPMEVIEKMLNEGEALNTDERQLLKNWVKEFNVKIKQLQDTPNTAIDLIKFQNFLFWVVKHFGKKEKLPQLFYALSEAGLILFSITDLQYKKSRSGDLVGKTFGEHVITEVQAKSGNRVVCKTKAGEVVAFYRNNPLAIFAEYGGRVNTTSFLMPEAKSLDYENHLVVLNSVEEGAQFDPNVDAHIYAIANAFTVVAKDGKTPLFTQNCSVKTSVQKNRSTLVFPTFIASVAGRRHDLFEPFLYQFIGEDHFNHLEAVFRLAGLNAKDESDKSSDLLILFINEYAIGNLVHATENELRAFILEKIQDCSIELVNQYVTLLMSATLTIRYCQEKIKKSSPDAYQDVQLVLLIGEVMTLLRQEKMKCMQFPLCFKEKVLKCVQHIVTHFLSVFRESKKSEMPIIRMQKSKESKDPLKPFLEEFSRKTPRLMDLVSVSTNHEDQYEIKAMMRVNNNFKELADCFVLSCWWVAAKVANKQSKDIDDVKEHVAVILTQWQGFCGNLDGLKQALEKKLLK